LDYSIFRLAGGLIISDPMQRMQVPSYQPTAKPTTFAPSGGSSVDPTIALNVTITNGAVTSIVGAPIKALAVGASIGSTTSALQTFIDAYFAPLKPGNAALVNSFIYLAISLSLYSALFNYFDVRCRGFGATEIAKLSPF